MPICMIGPSNPALLDLLSTWPLSLPYLVAKLHPQRSLRVSEIRLIFLILLTKKKLQGGRVKRVCMGL